jgi:hypothetical protein
MRNCCKGEKVYLGILTELQVLGAYGCENVVIVILRLHVGTPSLAPTRLD